MRHWYEGFIGFRYLRASPRRGFVSLIAGIAIVGLGLGVAVLIVVLSVMNGFEEVLRTRILSLTAHATISGLEGRIPNWREDVAKLAGFKGIISTAPYIEEQGLMTHGDKSSGVLLRGIVPDAEERVVDLNSHLLSGRLSDLAAGRYRVILGNALAEELGVKVGDRVVLVVALGDVTPLGVIPRMRAFEVAGIISVGMYEYDRRIALVAMQDAAKLLRMGDDVTGIRLNLTDMYAAPRVSRAAALSLGGGVAIQDWTNEHVNFFRSIAITKRILFCDSVVDGGGSRLQHRIDHGNGGEGQAPRHRDSAHFRLLARQHFVGVRGAGQFDRNARYRSRRAARRGGGGESAGPGARLGSHRRLQVPRRARVLHERPAGARSSG